MKETTTKIICEVALRAYQQSEQAREGNDERSRLDWQYVHERLMCALRAEAPAVSTKFDIWKCVAKDLIRPAMEGIYHDGGYKVASDGHILVWVKEEYPEGQEGRILKKDGSLLSEGTVYPRWRTVIPRDNACVVKVDIARFREAYKDWSDRMKAYRKGATEDDPGIGKVRVGGSWFKMDKFKLAADFMEAYGLDEVRVNGENARRAAMIGSEESDGFIIMPIDVDDDKAVADVAFE